MKYQLTYTQLLHDLYIAYFDARKYKTHKPYVLEFEKNLHQNLEALCRSLLNRTYKAQPSTCFIINYPKKREVFAAAFVDRIVHHLYYNYTHELYERTFIQDTYSCIKERGTLYGINRLYSHIRKESHNYQRSCYILHLDIRGYFMHIDRNVLLRIALGTLDRMSTHRIHKGCCKTWQEIVDIDFVKWLTEEIIMLNPKEKCIIVGSSDDWIGLDINKSLFYVEDGKGLPIGNLTSQLFSNVYLNALDQFMKRVLKCRHYGRYVDDSYVVSCDKEWLLSLVPQVEKFLAEVLCLELHLGKVSIDSSDKGVEFLGSYLKHHRTYISNHTLHRMNDKLSHTRMEDAEAVKRTVNSYLGMMKHHSSYHLRRRMFLRRRFLEASYYDNDYSKMYF